MLLDVLDAVDEIEVATEYRLDGKRLETLPASLPDFERMEVHYERFPSWKEDISGVKSFEELPKEAKDYVRALEKLIGISIDLVSVGPEEHQTLVRKEIFE